ncbi:hypothetical protein M9H77_14482 [Catharanthus roseus]|uniref:Uncharacterized protein n=1 Tax=Catharanthus roseus TaxID=4058 RepID=A0ACC0BNC0_CATRO|nr:hypothetical protein M9H77_14482 [Catharanthus roseus]
MMDTMKAMIMVPILMKDMTLVLTVGMMMEGGGYAFYGNRSYGDELMNFGEPSENQEGRLGYNSIKTICFFPSNSYLCFKKKDGFGVLKVCHRVFVETALRKDFLELLSKNFVEKHLCYFKTIIEIHWKDDFLDGLLVPNENSLVISMKHDCSGTLLHHLPFKEFLKKFVYEGKFGKSQDFTNKQSYTFFEEFLGFMSKSSWKKGLSNLVLDNLFVFNSPLGLYVDNILEPSFVFTSPCELKSSWNFKKNFDWMRFHYVVIHESLLKDLENESLNFHVPFKEIKSYMMGIHGWVLEFEKDESTDLRTNPFKGRTDSMTRGGQETVELMQGPITRAKAKRMEEEYKGEVALFETMLQDLAWHVLEEQREDLGG